MKLKDIDNWGYNDILKDVDMDVAQADEKFKKFKSYRNLGIALNIMCLLFLLLSYRYQRSSSIFLVMLFLFPLVFWLHIYLHRFLKKSLNVSRPFYMMSFGLMVLTFYFMMGETGYVYKNRLALILTIFVLLGLAYIVKNIGKRSKEETIRLLLNVTFLAFNSYGILSAANYHLDTSSPDYHVVKVVGKSEQTFSKSKRYYVYIKGYKPVSEYRLHEVSHGFHKRITEGENILLVSHDGGLGVPYYEFRRIKKAP